MGIPSDKRNHFLAGAGITLGVSVGLQVLGVDARTANAYGWFVSTVVSGLKEVVWDLALGRGTPDLMDFVYGVGGAAAASGVLVTVELVF